MPSFRYQSLTARGELRQGVISAASRGSAIRLLKGRGETPTTIEELNKDAGGAAPAPGAGALILRALPRPCAAGRPPTS